MEGQECRRSCGFLGAGEQVQDAASVWLVCAANAGASIASLMIEGLALPEDGCAASVYCRQHEARGHRSPLWPAPCWAPLRRAAAVSPPPDLNKPTTTTHFSRDLRHPRRALRRARPTLAGTIDTLPTCRPLCTARRPPSLLDAGPLEAAHSTVSISPRQRRRVPFSTPSAPLRAPPAAIGHLAARPRPYLPRRPGSPPPPEPAVTTAAGAPATARRGARAERRSVYSCPSWRSLGRAIRR